MENLTKSFLCAGLAGGIAILAHGQTVVVDETFDGYSTTAEMQANWNGGGNGSLDLAFGNDAPAAEHPGGAVNSWTGSFSLTPTDDQPIILRGDIYDSGSAGSNTIGLRGGPFPLFEMGHYEWDQTAGGGGADNYKIRINSFAGGENWVGLSNEDVAPGEGPVGWNRWEATFTESTVTVTLDIGINGTTDYSFFSEHPDGTATGAFSDLRFGGPSNLMSADSTVHFDNIQLTQVPEPSTYAAIFGGLALLGAFAWRRRWKK